MGCLSFLSVCPSYINGKSLFFLKKDLSLGLNHDTLNPINNYEKNKSVLFRRFGKSKNKKNALYRGVGKS